MVAKGSVCIDGVSLTIARMDESGFSVSVIPTTLKETTLGATKVGDVVNIETDIITKTVKKQLAKMLPGKETLTAQRLKELGF
jgi:riboflavin synthase